MTFWQYVDDNFFGLIVCIILLAGVLLIALNMFL